MFYPAGKRFLNYCLRQFFREISIKGTEPRESGPLVIVANHPNMALDPFLVLHLYKRDLYFLAKSTLFRGMLLSKFMHACHMIPVYRKQDNPGDMGKNVEMFRAAQDVVTSGKALALFPEGVSLGERRLQELKTGAARISLQAEEHSRFSLGLVIQPIGITYTDLDSFKGSVSLFVGQPIEVRDYKSAYEANAIEAAHALTEEIERRLKQLTVEIESAQHDTLVEKIGRVYESRNPDIDHHERLHLIAKNVEQVGPAMPQKRVEIERRIDEYLATAAVFNLTGSEDLTKQYQSLEMLVLLPFALFAFLVNVVPYRLTGRVAAKLSSDPVSQATMKFGVGMGLFTAWYTLLSVLFWLLTGSILAALMFYGAVVVSGLFANRYIEHIRLYLLSSFWPGSKNPVELVRLMKEDLIRELESLRVV